TKEIGSTFGQLALRIEMQTGRELRLSKQTGDHVCGRSLSLWEKDSPENLQLTWTVLVYDRRQSSTCDIVGGHRPPLQKNGTIDLSVPSASPTPFRFRVL